MFWIKAILIKVPTRVALSSSTIIDHILASSFPKGVTQYQGFIQAILMSNIPHKKLNLAIEF